MADHTYPAPTILDSVTDSSTGDSITTALPLANDPQVNDSFIAFVLAVWNGGTPGTITYSQTAGWTKQVSLTGSSERFIHLSVYLKNAYDGIETDATFTAAATPDASTIITSIFRLNFHQTGGLSTQQVFRSSNSQVGVDIRYHSGMTIEPHTELGEPTMVRSLVFDLIYGTMDEGDSWGAPSAPPPGFTMASSQIIDDSHLHICYKRQTDPSFSEDPGYPSVGVGGWLFQETGNAWTWTDVGTPENQDGSPSPPEFAFQFLGEGLLEMIHFHDYFVEIEEDVPYWGILSTPSTES